MKNTTFLWYHHQVFQSIKSLGLFLFCFAFPFLAQGQMDSLSNELMSLQMIPSRTIDTVHSIYSIDYPRKRGKHWHYFNCHHARTTGNIYFIDGKRVRAVSRRGWAPGWQGTIFKSQDYRFHYPELTDDLYNRNRMQNTLSTVSDLDRLGYGFTQPKRIALPPFRMEAPDKKKAQQKTDEKDPSNSTPNEEEKNKADQ